MAFNREKALTAAAKFVSKGQHDRAAKEYVAIIEADPNDTRSWLLLAEALTNAGDKPGAIERYLHVAEGYAGTNEAQKAIAVYRKVLALDPNRLDIQTRIAALYKDLGRTADAVAAYEFVAQAYFQAGQIAEGLEGFRMVAELEPAAVGKRLRLAELYSREGMVAQAVEHFRLAADRLLADRRTDDYIRVAERLIYHKEDDLPVLRSLAQIYLKQGENRRALVKLNALLRAAPADAEGLELLGETFVAIGKVDKAISVVMELAREQRKGGRKNKETAARVLRKALAWNPENVEDIRKLAAEIEAEVAALPPDPEPGEPKPREEGMDLDVDVVEEDAAAASSTDVDIDVDIDEDEEERKVEEVPSRPFAPVGANVAPSVVEDGEEGVGDVEKILLEARVYVKYKMFEHALGHLDAVFVRDANHVAALELQAQILAELGRNADAADSYVRLAQLVSSTDLRQARAHLELAQKLVPDHTKADMVLAALDSGDSGDSGETAPLVRGLQASLSGDPASEPTTPDRPEDAEQSAPDRVTPAEADSAADDTEADATDEPETTTDAPSDAAAPADATDASASTDASADAPPTAEPVASADATPSEPAVQPEATLASEPAADASADKPPTERTPLPGALPVKPSGEKTPLPARFGEGTPLPVFKPPAPEPARSEADGAPPTSTPAAPQDENVPRPRPRPGARVRKPAAPEPSPEIEELDSGVIEELDADEVAEVVDVVEVVEVIEAPKKPAPPRRGPPSRPAPPAKRPPPPKPTPGRSEDSKVQAAPEDSKVQAVPEDSKAGPAPEDSKVQAVPEDSKVQPAPNDAGSETGKAAPDTTPAVPADSTAADTTPAVPADSTTADAASAVPADRTTADTTPAVPADSTTADTTPAVSEDSKAAPGTTPAAPEDSTAATATTAAPEGSTATPATPEDRAATDTAAPADTTAAPDSTPPAPTDSKAAADTTSPVPTDSKAAADTTSPVPADSTTASDTTSPVPADSTTASDTTSPVPADSTLASDATPVPADSKPATPAAAELSADVTPAAEQAETDAPVAADAATTRTAAPASEPAAPSTTASVSEPNPGDTAMMAIDAVLSPDPVWPDISDEIDELRFFISSRFEDDAQFAYLDLQRRFPGHPALVEFADRLATGAKLDSAAAPVELDDPRPASVPSRGASPARVAVLDEDEEDTFLASIFDEPVTRAPGKSAKPRRAVASLDDAADPQTFFDLGTAYREMGLEDDALTQFDLAAKDPRWTSRARIMSASLRIQRGEHEQAIDDLNLAIDFATDVDQRSEAGYELGVLYQTLGDKPAAIEALEAVVAGYRDRDERLKALEG